MSPHRLYPAFWLSVALWAQGGCATPSVWEAAKLESRSVVIVEGVAPATADGQGRRLVVSYLGQGVSDLSTSIPLDASGSPPAPFAYAGKFRNLSDIERDLAPGQRQAVANHTFDVAARADARSARGARGYAAFDEFGHFPAELKGGDVAVVALRPDGTPVRTSGHADEDVQFPADSRILLIPGRQARSAGERRLSTVRAVLLTPLTVAADAALITVAIPLRLLFGGC